MTLEIALKTIQRITDEFNLETLRPQIQACERLIADTLKVDVAVFGRFKAGKSSFLNHLLSRPRRPPKTAHLWPLENRPPCLSAA